MSCLLLAAGLIALAWLWWLSYRETPPHDRDPDLPI